MITQNLLVDFILDYWSHFSDFSEFLKRTQSEYGGRRRKFSAALHQICTAVP